MTVLLPHPVDESTWGSATWPLGATYDAATSSTTFAVESPHASKVAVEVYSFAVGHAPLLQAQMTKGKDGVWRARLGSVGPGTKYGFRMWPADAKPATPSGQATPSPSTPPTQAAPSPTTPPTQAAAQLNPAKLVLDPKGKDVSHHVDDPEVAEALEAAGLDRSALGSEGECGGRPCRDIDTGAFAPKSIVPQAAHPAGVTPTTPATPTAAPAKESGVRRAIDRLRGKHRH